jgi:hypothetical protein
MELSIRDKSTHHTDQLPMDNPGMNSCAPISFKNYQELFRQKALFKEELYLIYEPNIYLHLPLLCLCIVFLLYLLLNESPSGFSGIRVTQSLVLYICFVDRCLSLCPFSFGHCVVCPSSIYGFWLLRLKTHISSEIIIKRFYVALHQENGRFWYHYKTLLCSIAPRER